MNDDCTASYRYAEKVAVNSQITPESNPERNSVAYDVDSVALVDSFAENEIGYVTSVGRRDSRCVESDMAEARLDIGVSVRYKYNRLFTLPRKCVIDYAFVGLRFRTLAHGYFDASVRRDESEYATAFCDKCDTCCIVVEPADNDSPERASTPFVLYEYRLRSSVGLVSYRCDVEDRRSGIAEYDVVKIARTCIRVIRNLVNHSAVGCEFCVVHCYELDCTTDVASFRSGRISFGDLDGRCSIYDGDRAFETASVLEMDWHPCEIEYRQVSSETCPVLFIECREQIDSERLRVRLYLEVLVRIDKDENFSLFSDIDVSALFDTADVETFYLLVFSPLGEAGNIGEVFERELSVGLLVCREQPFVVSSADYHVVVRILRGVGDFLAVEPSVEHCDFGFASDSPTRRRAVGKSRSDDGVFADEHSVHVWSAVTLTTVSTCVSLY